MAKRKTYKTSIQQGYIDEETGEIFNQYVVTEQVEGYVDLKLPTKHRLDNGNFIVLFQKAMLEIALNHHLFTRSEMAILFYLLGTAGIGNSISIDYPTLVNELNIKRTHCSTAINTLVKKGIIVRNKSRQRMKNESQLMNLSVNFDQLNYNLAYNGKMKDFKSLKYNHPEISLNSSDNNIDEPNPFFLEQTGEK
jgi:hypothetical protein